MYDALNQKVSATTSAETSEFTYDYLGRRLETWNPSTNVATQVQVYWGTGKPFAYRAVDGTTYFQHADWLGTQRALTNYTGGTVASYQSLPFGDGVSSSGQNDNLSHFADQDQDAVSGLSKATFRTMSTTHGRWLSPDPYTGSYDLTNPQSLNRYSYALNNPLNNVDPTGLDCAFFQGDGRPQPASDSDHSEDDVDPQQCGFDGGVWIEGTIDWNSTPLYDTSTQSYIFTSVDEDGSTLVTFAPVSFEGDTTVTVNGVATPPVDVTPQYVSGIFDQHKYIEYNNCNYTSWLSPFPGPCKVINFVLLLKIYDSLPIQPF